jgi:acyl-ACP thioesterase
MLQAILHCPRLPKTAVKKLSKLNAHSYPVKLVNMNLPLHVINVIYYFHVYIYLFLKTIPH